jgi:hypothetical protein
MLARLIDAHIDITLALASNLPLALADRDQLERVMMEIVVTARDSARVGSHVSRP